jgi:hypothetical protein
LLQKAADCARSVTGAIQVIQAELQERLTRLGFPARMV